jgi:elongation factor P--(R)-beta-lysine ligase
LLVLRSIRVKSNRVKLETYGSYTDIVDDVNDYRQTRIQKNLWLRAQIIQIIRQFFINAHFLEVETPVRISSPAPERHIHAVPSGSWCLQASPELFMKRLLSAGYSRIFQICKCFRSDERGNRHLGEFTLLEWYCTEMDYFAYMDQCEALIQAVASGLGQNNSLFYRGKEIDLTSPWERIPVTDAFYRWAAISPEEALRQDRFDEIMVDAIEPNLGFITPAFLYDYPVECGALARRDPKNKNIAQRFELYISGMELCNAFMELTDPIEQRARFEQEKSEMRRLAKPDYPLPEKFLNTLEDMPESAGNALGIDRLIMLFADTRSIDDVVAFTPEEI